MGKKPDDSDAGARQWAIGIMDKYSPIPLPASMKGAQSIIIYKPGPEVFVPVPVFPSPPTELMDCRKNISPVPMKMFEDREKQGRGKRTLSIG